MTDVAHHWLFVVDCMVVVLQHVSCIEIAPKTVQCACLQQQQQQRSNNP